MIDQLALAITLACLIAALYVGVRGVLGRHRWRGTWPTLAVIECAMLVQAGVDLLAQASGRHPGEPVTHLAYLATSLAVLPVAASQAARDNGRWAAVLVAVALLVLAVVVIRMQTTWRPGHG